jgi:tRNASer (uridine44-2'-O)-methyltransferase
MVVRKRAPVAATEKPLRDTVIPSVNILYKSYSGGENEQASHLAGKDQDVEPDRSTVAATTIPSASTTESDDEEISKWMTSPDLIRENLPFTPDVMYNLNNFLLGSPNINSPHLFRADILYDSAGQLKTPREKERLVLGAESAGQSQNAVDDNSGSYAETEAGTPPHITGFELKRTVVRELIPRRPNLDRALKQTCLYYEGVASTSSQHAEDDGDAVSVQRALYLFMPDLNAPEDVPFYHPVIRGWGFLYDYEETSSCSSPQNEESQNSQQQKGETDSPSGNGTLSLHILPFPSAEGFEPFPVRLERILQNLLSTHIRLARNTRPTTTTSSTSTDTPTASDSHNNVSTTGKKQEDDSYNPDKDNIIPRHMVQNTYARLKTAYSQDLCQRWVENTEPAKHVFEDLAITAFLIELWRNMYGAIPRAEQDGKIEERTDGLEFPGFVDIACGNGVLVYVLLMEGYRGWGFDARRRKTWSIFPEWIQKNLEEAIYIPEPFAEEFVSTGTATTTDVVGGDSVHQRIQSHNGIQYTTGNFPKKTFVISNHADELTVWTPLLAALACPEEPLPFISIPCCSHALSGARYRYRPPKKEKSTTTTTKENTEDTNDNPQTGDLKALRAAKQAASTSLPDSDPNSTAVLNSMYGSLTAKTMSVAAEVGFNVEKTLLRIPSTRNMGVIGGRRDAISTRMATVQRSMNAETVRRLIDEVVERECGMDGGVSAAAKIWVERAMGLQKPSKRSS